MNITELLIVLAIGAVAGWLAGVIMKGGGFGLIVDIIIGIIGAFIGGWIFAQLGVTMSSSIINAIITSTVGAVALIAVIRIIKRVL